MDPFVDIAALPSLGPIHYLGARDRVMFDAGHDRLLCPGRALRRAAQARAVLDGFAPVWKAAWKSDPA